MNTMKWLLKREYWEHKGGFFWAQVVVGAIMLLFLIASVATGVAMGRQGGYSVDGQSLTDLSRHMSASDHAAVTQFAHGLASGYLGIGAPMFLTMAVVVFFFCLGCLFDDRKDRSMLFWKSLPISDAATVLSKVTMALVAVPLLTIGFATVATLAMLLVIALGAAAVGVNLFGDILTSAQFYLSPLEAIAIVPVYAAWALPTVGWLMLVSAWARTKPFLWAVATPILAGTLLSWSRAMFRVDWNDEWFWQHIVGRGLLSITPGSWFFFRPMHDFDGPVVRVSAGYAAHGSNGMDAIMAQSWEMFTTADLWIGLALGAAMIYAAIRLRRWRDEG